MPLPADDAVLSRAAAEQAATVANPMVVASMRPKRASSGNPGLGPKATGETVSAANPAENVAKKEICCPNLPAVTVSVTVASSRKMKRKKKKRPRAEPPPPPRMLVAARVAPPLVARTPSVPPALLAARQLAVNPSPPRTKKAPSPT